MRLRRLDLVRYGRFTERTIDFGEPVAGAPDLHIVHGPNEAGKSTALAGFLDLLFGIEPQSRFDFLHPYATMRIGGCLELSGGARELVRIKRPQLSLRDAQDAPLPEGLILGDLGGLDRTAYRTMFSLDDDTLEAGGKSILASNGELGQLLFSASAGLSELSRTLLDLRAEAEQFTRPHARNSLLQQLRAEIAGLRQERDAIDTLAAAYRQRVTAADTAQAQYDGAEADRMRTQAALAGLRRRLAALPHLATLADLRRRLEPLADLPAAPPGWLAELPTLEQAESRIRSETELAEAEVRRLAEARDALIPDLPALRLVGRLDPLEQLRARHVTAELDLPGRRQELAGADGTIGGILARLGRPGEPEPARLLLTAAQIAALNGLTMSRSGIQTKLAAARDELARAAHALTEARRALEGAGSAAPVLVPVAAALAALRESDHPVRRRGAERAEAQHAETLALRLAALAPWEGSVETLAALALPAESDLLAWQAADADDAAALTGHRAEVERIESDVARRTAELDAVARSEGGVVDDEAAALRRVREAAWAAHRTALDAVTADAFEAAMRRDDLVAQARLGQERDLATLREATRGLAVRRAEAKHAQALRDAAAARCRERRACVSRAATALGPEFAADISPARLLAWMDLRLRALESWDALRQAAHDRRAAETDAAALRERLVAALRQASVPFETTAATDALAALAQEAVDRAQQAQALRRAAAEAEREVGRRELALQAAALADKTWNSAWRVACRACWLGDLPPEAGGAMLETVAALGHALRARETLAGRIRDMEADQDAFARELARLCPALGIDPAGQPALGLAQQVAERVEAAARDAAERARLQTALDAAQDRRRQLAAGARAHALRVGEMKDHLHAASLTDLAGKLRDAALKADLEDRAAQTERDICHALGVATLAAAAAMLGAPDLAALEGEAARLGGELEDHQRRTREFFAASRAAADAIAAIGGDDAVARIEERRRTRLLEIEDRAQRWLRLRAGIAAADRALRAYRDRHRSAMLNQASDVFRAISGGAYRGLGTQPGKDGDILVALAADGGSRLATELSKGTRFQLYLALRAAGYREFARQRLPVPFVADDIMETFDDFRSERTLRVFADMARCGQVIYLTHHDHLRAMAERAIPGVRVHHLAP